MRAKKTGLEQIFMNHSTKIDTNLKSSHDNCPCCSGKPFKRCCAPLLLGEVKAKTPVALMRSRYTAYAIGGHGDYLYRTWWPSARSGLNKAELSLRTNNWRKLEIIAKSQSGDRGLVEFKAFFHDANNIEQVHHERSEFCCEGGRWYYVGFFENNL